MITPEQQLLKYLARIATALETMATPNELDEEHTRKLLALCEAQLKWQNDLNDKYKQKG